MWISYLRGKFKPKTLKKNMNRYFLNYRKDICCEENINRAVVIQHLFELYTDISGNENTALDEMHEDFLKFIGYKKDDKKNYKGEALYKQMNNETRSKGKLDRESMIKVMQEIPLYYILSFLGYAFYRHKIDVVPNSLPSPRDTVEENEPTRPQPRKSPMDMNNMPPLTI